MYDVGLSFLLDKLGNEVVLLWYGEKPSQERESQSFCFTSHDYLNLS